jgi:cyclohexyl-isocyanide hydratase
LTGGGISSGLDEALKLIILLLGREKAEFVQRMTQYYPKPPVSSEITPATDCPVPPVIITPPR